MITLIIVGDIIVCGFLAGLVAWLFARADSKKLQEAAELPLLDDDDSWNGGKDTGAAAGDDKA